MAGKVRTSGRINALMWQCAVMSVGGSWGIGRPLLRAMCPGLRAMCLRRETAWLGGALKTSTTATWWQRDSVTDTRLSRASCAAGPKTCPGAS